MKESGWLMTRVEKEWIVSVRAQWIAFWTTFSQTFTDGAAISSKSLFACAAVRTVSVDTYCVVVTRTGF